MSISIRPKPAEPVAIQVVEQEPATKAGFYSLGQGGAGPLVYEHPLNSVTIFGRQNESRRIRRAWEVGMSVPWIRAAERVISGTFSTVAWHLEDGDDQNVDDAYTNPQAQRARSLIEKPQANMTVGRQLTRRELWALTCRHMGLCGVAFWYLDQREAFAGTPAAVLYIRPDRMTPDEDSAGNLVGWLLDVGDTDRPTVKFKLTEIVQFTLDPPDTGHYGSGLVESAMLKAQNSGALDRHLSSVMGGGGRLAGILSPKEGDSLNDTQYAQLVADARSVSEATDSAKRLHILRGPVDFTQTAMNLQQLALSDMLTNSRDDLLTLWGVPLSQVGGSPPGGMNSGETRKYDYQALIQNAVHPRWVAFAEAVQFQLLDRWGKLGLTLDLVIEEPEFDSDLGRYDLVAKTSTAPLRNRERRELLGLEPLGTPQDDEVWLPLSQVQAFIAPSDETASVVVIEPLIQQLEPGDTQDETAVAQKASLHRGHTSLRSSLRRLHSTVAGKLEPKVKTAIQNVLAEQQRELKQRVRDKAGHLLSNPSDVRSIWDKGKWDKRMRDAVASALEAVAEQVDSHVRSTLEAPAVKAITAPSRRAILHVLELGGLRITGLNDTTLSAVLAILRPILADAIERGLSPAATADLLEVALDDVTLDNGMPAFGELRTETIARTELGQAYNDATIESYRELGVTKVEAIDGDQDEECAERNGQVFDIDEAADIQDHPNGTLDWLPVIEDEPVAVKALVPWEASMPEKPALVSPAFGVPQITMPLTLQQPATDMEPVADVLRQLVSAQAANTGVLKAWLDRFEMPVPHVTNVLPEQAPPTVNVQVPAQPAPVVHFTAPEQKAGLPQQIEIVAMPNRISRTVKEITHDRAGQITRVEEKAVDTDGS